MADIPTQTTDPQAAARQFMRYQFLANLDSHIEQAGGQTAFYYTLPLNQLQDLGAKATSTLQQAAADPMHHDTGFAFDQTARIMQAREQVADELEVRYLLSSDLDEPEIMAHADSSELRAMQQRIDARIEFHDHVASQPGYTHPRGPEEGFDHEAAASISANYLAQLQVEAYERGDEPHPSESSKLLYGERLFNRWTAHAVESGNPDAASSLAEHIGTLNDYQRTAVDAIRRYRAAQPAGHISLKADYGYDQDEWDQAAHQVETAVDIAHGRDPDMSLTVNTQLAADRQRMFDDYRYGADTAGTVDLDAELQKLLNQQPAPVAAATPIRDQYLDARARAGAAGMQLADPTVQVALSLHGLQQQHATITGQLEHADTHQPGMFNRQAGRQWREHVAGLNTQLEGLDHDIELHSNELGPDPQTAVDNAVNLRLTRDQLVQEAMGLHDAAIREEVDRDPKWLQTTLGPRPEEARETARWERLAGELASHRLTFHITDDADNGIRVEHQALLDKVTEYGAARETGVSSQIEPDLTQGL